MDEEDFSSLPLEEKLSHKSWKARQQSYEELSRKFRIADSQKDNIFWNYFDHVKKFPLESNVVAQETAISCMTAYLECCDPAIGKKLRPEVTASVIEKGLSAVKSGTRAKTVEVLMILIELDIAEPVVTELAMFLNHKQPKLVAATINCLTDIVRCFGANVTNAKSIIKVISGSFCHADKNVRSEGTALVVELSRWLGPSILATLNGLKPVQMKELQELCSQAPSICPTPTRYLRSQRPVAILEKDSLAIKNYDDTMCEDLPNSQSSQSSKSLAVQKPGIIDAYDLAESVDVNTKIPSNFFEMLSSNSWKDRKEALENFLPLIKVPKISDKSRYGELVDALCKRVGDVNVLVVIFAAGCIDAMASGLRSNFSPYRSSAIDALLEKTKEKKQNVVDAIRAALDSLRFCIYQINESFFEELVPFLAHKNPSVRSETLLWLSRIMQLHPQIPSKKECKAIVEAVLPTMDDGSTEVREASALCLAHVQKILGESGSVPFFEKLEKIKLNKIKELCSKIQSIGPESNNAPIKKAPNRPVPAPPLPTSQPNRKIPAESQLTSQSAPKSRKMDTDTGSSALSFVHTDEEAIKFFFEWFGEDICNELADSVWKVRLAAIELVYEKIDKAVELPLGFSTELLVRFFSQRPSWKDSNFQVLGKVVTCLIRIAKHQFYTRESTSLLISGLVEKLSDPKLRSDCGELFMILGEQVSINFVIVQIIECVRSQKSPKIQADIVKWIQSAVHDFGIEGIQIPILIDLCKFCLSNSNPTVRGVAVSLAGTLRIFVGADLKLLFNDVPSSVLTTLDAEFIRVANELVPVPIRHYISRSSQSCSITNSSIVDNSGSESALIDDLIPRTNITLQINDSLLNKLADPSWKVRKAGLDELAQILSAAHNRIKYTGFELFNSLKSRLSDSNKNLSLQALEICGLLSEAMGSAFEKHLRILLPSVLETLSDNKIQVRQAALKALDRFLLASPISTFFSSIGPALLADSPNTRRELLNWTTGVLLQPQKHALDKDEILDTVGQIVGCLQDRSVEVRKAAQAMVSTLLEHIPADAVKKACSDQQPKLLLTLQPLLEAAKKNSGSSVSITLSSSSTNSVPQVAPKTPQRAISMRQTRPVTPIKLSASMHSFTDEISKNHLDEFPLLSADPSGKSLRAEKDKGSARWTFDTPRKDIVDFLREQMIGNISYALIGKLFSDDFKDNIAAMNRFEEFINVASDDETKAKFVVNLDLLLKYLTLRFFDTNTSVLIKALELTEAIVSFMDNCNYRLSEYEAGSFLPFLIAKMGDGKEAMRIKIHSIFRQICRIYPASKIFAFFMEGLKHKNSRTRAECLEELAKLLSRNGLSVLQSSRHLPIIGSLISDRDSQVRNAALNVLVQANQLMGPASLQKYLQGLSAKDLDLLDERLKRVAAGIKEEHVVKVENLDMIDVPLPQIIENPTEIASTALGLNYSSFMDDLPAPTLPSIRRIFEPSLLSNPLDHAIDQIQFSTDLVCIHALQALETNLNGTESEEDLRPRVNDLTHALIVRLKEATSISYDIQEISQMKSRLCRYVTNALVLITTNVSFCRELNEDVIELLVSETLSALVNDKIRLFEDKDQLEKALNILIVKVLEGVPQNRSYCALLTVLREAFRVPPAETDKFPELVMKCLWKLTKQLAGHLQVVGRINVPELLGEVHSFLTALPPIEWKMRNNEGLAFQDLPLRTVKTILHEIVLHRGICVLDELSMIPDPQESFVLSYLKAMLQARGVSDQEISNQLNLAGDVAMEVDSTVETNDIDMIVDEQSEQAGEESRKFSIEQISSFLREVCSQICSKPDTRIGLQQLYEFRCAHPYALEQINQFLAGLGDFFHKYIIRCLERIEVEHNQAINLKRSAINSSDLDNSVEAYKQKLIQLRQQIFGSEVENSGNFNSENQQPNSPTSSVLRRANSHIVSPKMRSIKSNGPETPTKLSAAMDLASASATAPFGNPSQSPASPSSILSLKERLARLRDEHEEKYSKKNEENILDIIEREFDLELLLKYREMRILENELERGKELKVILEKLILNEQIYADKSSGRLSAPPQFNFMLPTMDSDTGPNSFIEDYEIYAQKTKNSDINRLIQPFSSGKSISSAQQFQYDIRSDGTVLRMRCPTCGAEKFRSMLGFLNHCRIHCKLIFSNQEERLQNCGIPVPPDEIPLEFQNISHSLVKKSIELAQICADVLPTKIVEDSKPEIMVIEAGSLDLSDFGVSSSKSAVVTRTDNDSNNYNRHSDNHESKNRSRYYIKKELIIGNLSRCLLASGEIDDSVGGRPATHYFKLFIRDVNFKSKNRHPLNDLSYNLNDRGILKHIKFVRFILHPAYKPNDVIDIYEQPFVIEKPAWGEFPVRIQLHFLDEKNKPVDLVHLLSIFSAVSAKYDQGVERLHEIEIDKNTDLSLSCSPDERTNFLPEVLESESDESDSESVSVTTASYDNEVENGFINIEKPSAIDPKNLKYCRYCGIPHMPQQSFEVIQKNCAHKPRKIRLNSRTLPSELFSHCKLYDHDLQFVSNKDESTYETKKSLEPEVFVSSDSSDFVKLVATSAHLLDLPHFLPFENVSFTLAAAVKCFLRHLITKSIKNIPDPSLRAALDQKLPSVVSPLHVFQAVTVAGSANSSTDSSLLNNLDTSSNVFDFLSNAYFSASNSSSKSNN